MSRTGGHCDLPGDRARQTRRGFQRRSAGGLCVEVSVPVSPSFRFSPVGLDDDGPGLCVELVLPIVCPEESCPEEGFDAPPGPIACPEEELDAPPAFSAKETVVVPVKRAIATTAAAILRCMLHSFCCCGCFKAGNLADAGAGSTPPVNLRKTAQVVPICLRAKLILHSAEGGCCRFLTLIQRRNRTPR